MGLHLFGYIFLFISSSVFLGGILKWEWYLIGPLMLVIVTLITSNIMKYIINDRKKIKNPDGTFYWTTQFHKNRASLFGGVYTILSIAMLAINLFKN